MLISESVRTSTTQDGVVLMDIRQGMMFWLNPIGSLIWKQLADGCSTNQIAAQLVADFGISLDQATSDTQELLKELEAQHLLCPPGSEAGQ